MQMKTVAFNNFAIGLKSLGPNKHMCLKVQKQEKDMKKVDLIDSKKKFIFVNAKLFLFKIW